MTAPMTHTPGPWAVNPLRAQVDALPSAVPICQLLWPTPERSEVETFANAKLIAAAPDLYAAAIAARDENRHGDGSSKSLAALDKILCDAIAKAEGRR